ncbi:MAG TPA: hypothetical protein VLG37_04425 [Candidatus Saccharimonadales bacterium]|nr:hypothetical protein [Candidatus Saccharimonadales bacterium]
MKPKKKNERASFWVELFLFVWGLAYVVIGVFCWYLIFTVERAEPLAILFLAAVGSFTLWSGGSTLLDMFKED